MGGKKLPEPPTAVQSVAKLCVFCGEICWVYQQSPTKAAFHLNVLEWAFAVKTFCIQIVSKSEIFILKTICSLVYQRLASPMNTKDRYIQILWYLSRFCRCTCVDNEPLHYMKSFCNNDNGGRGRE